MPSASPSPVKRPSIQERTSSTASLSSSGKAAGATKQPRPHYVSRQSRNVSYGKGLNNMGKKAMAAALAEGGKNHARKKSGQLTPTASPKPNPAAQMKRNSSHITLPKNRSHGNLRKNHSAKTLTALNRNHSLGALNKLGEPLQQRTKKEEGKQGVFDLAGSGSENEDEGEWEDSTASPEMTRNNSKAPTPIQTHSPVGAPMQKPPVEQPVVPEKTSSPPEPNVLKTNRSAPDFQLPRKVSDRPVQDPALLLPNGRGLRAPPAMTTAIARAEVPRTDSQRSLHKHPRSNTETNTPETPQTTGTFALGPSSGSVSVSHFLTSMDDASLPRTSKDEDAFSDDDEESDSLSVRDFMSNYKPQASDSPEKPRHTLNKARVPSVPSRTQQKLELQRREVMRGNGPTGPTGAGLAFSAGSSVSAHSRSASRGRTRTSMAGDFKLVKQDYDTAVRQLTVVRRFRNPVLESLNRLKQNNVVPIDKGSGPTSATSNTHPAVKRPPSRYGRSSTTQLATANGAGSKSDSDAPTAEPRDSKVPHVSFQTNAPPHPRHTAAEGPGTGTGKVKFQISRQTSHDDDVNNFTTSQGISPETQNEDDGISMDEALIRRMWESRVHIGIA